MTQQAAHTKAFQCGEFGYGGVTSAASSAYEGVSDVASSAYSGVGDYAGRAYEKVGDYGTQAREQYDYYIEENPLAVGAVALAFGAAVGFAIPSTRYESDLMGEYSQQVYDKAQTAASVWLISQNGSTERCKPFRKPSTKPLKKSYRKA